MKNILIVLMMVIITSCATTNGLTKREQNVLRKDTVLAKAQLMEKYDEKISKKGWRNYSWALIIAASVGIFLNSNDVIYYDGKEWKMRKF